MSKTEALEYLKGRKLGNKLALRLYGLVGGRIVHLEMAADYVKDQNMDFDGMYGPVSCAENGVGHGRKRIGRIQSRIHESKSKAFDSNEPNPTFRFFDSQHH